MRPLSLSHRAPAPPPAPPSTPNPAVPKVTLTPDLILSDYGSIISNLAGPDELRRMVRGMERNTWEAAALLRTHVRVEAALASRPPPRSRRTAPRTALRAWRRPRRRRPSPRRWRPSLPRRRRPHPRREVSRWAACACARQPVAPAVRLGDERETTVVSHVSSSAIGCTVATTIRWIPPHYEFRSTYSLFSHTHSREHSASTFSAAPRPMGMGPWPPSTVHSQRLGGPGCVPP